MIEKYTVYEAMAAAVSHELNDFENWFIGLATGSTTIQILSRVPIVSMALAQHTHAPNSIMAPGRCMNPVISEIPTGMECEFSTELLYWRCESNRGFGGYLSERGEVDVGFGSAAQIDKYGNVNISAIGDYHRPKVRLIGAINLPCHFSRFKREIIIVMHKKRTFVDKVDFVSGAGYLDGPGAREKAGIPGGGPCMILTDKAIFDFDPETKLVRLKSIHPGVNLDNVLENTGFTHDYVPKNVPETSSPTDEELRLIREVIDPRGVLIPR
ncbi:CoA-transferase [Thermodesulfobacteriota bacterium]